MAADEHQGMPTRRCEVRCGSSAPAEARAFVAEVGRSWELSTGMVECAQLATSELVSNSVEHALSGVEIMLSLSASSRLRIAVRDNSHAFPILQPQGVTGPRGRGMALVEALAEVWGVTPHTDGKTVWLQLGPDAANSVLERPHVGQVTKRFTN